MSCQFREARRAEDVVIAVRHTVSLRGSLTRLLAANICVDEFVDGS